MTHAECLLGRGFFYHSSTLVNRFSEVHALEHDQAVDYLAEQ